MSYFVNSNYIKVYPTAYRNQAYSWVGNQAVPITDVTSFNPESRLNSEFNITNLTMRLPFKDSYVIRQEVSSASSPYPSVLYFCIGGYWFALLEDGISALVNDTDGYFKDNDEVHAYIKISALNGTTYTGKEYEAYSLINLNHTVVNVLDEKISSSSNDFQFCGLGFMSSMTGVSYTHKLKLLEKKDGKWRVPATSLFQITSKKIEDYANAGIDITEKFTTGALQVDTSANIDGATTITGTTTITGDTSITGDLSASGDAHLITATNQLLVEAGDSCFSVHTAGATFYKTGDGTKLDIKFDKLTSLIPFDLVGNLEIKDNTTTNFKVAAASGNVTATGNLTIGGTTTLKNSLSIKNGDTEKFSVAYDTGNFVSQGAGTIKSNLTVEGSSIVLSGLNKPSSASTYYPLCIDKDGNVNSQDCDGSQSNITTTGLDVITAIAQNNAGKITSVSTTNIPTASTTSLGVVKSTTTGTTTDRNYSVEVNSDGTMKVNVPWTDTTPVGSGAKSTDYYIVGVEDTGGHQDLKALGSYFWQDGNGYDWLNSGYIEADYSLRVGPGAAWHVDASSSYGAETTGTLKFGSTTYFGSASYYIDNAGNCVLNTYDTPSDIRLKENLKPFETNSSILDLPLFEFDYKESKKHSFGCIAQDLQKLYPEIVHEREDGYLTIEESKLVYLLLNEVKKLRKELNELKGVN